MKKTTILHKRLECIGCGLCAEVAPNYWYMDENGLARLHSKTHDDGPYEVAQVWSSDMTSLTQAEEGCPVQIIKLNK